MEQVLYQLPDGWEWKSLGDLVEFKNGYAFKSNVFSDSGIPVLRISNIQSGGISDRNMTYIPSEKLDVKAADFYVEPGDIVIAMSGATTGKVATNNTEDRLLQNQRVGRFIIADKTFRKYVLYYLGNKVEENLQKSLGAAQPNLSTAQIKEIKIPIQPANEQKRIVEKLDALLSRIDTAIEHLQESVTLADALFSSALNRVFNPSGTKVNFDSCYGLPEGWDWRTVNDLSTKIQYGHTAKAADKGNAQFLRITDIQDNNIDWLGVPFVDLKEKEIEKYALKDNDLVFARSGATAGKSILIKEPPRNAIFASYLIRIVPDKETIQPEYLELFFKSPAYWDIVKANAAGAAQPNINGSKLGEFKVPTPSMEIQKRIVDEMSSLSARVTELKKELRDKVYFIESAKSSILNSAFKGEL